MLIKSFCLGAVLLSTPLCLMDSQDPVPARKAPPAQEQQDPKPTKGETLSARQRAELEKVRRELRGAKKDLAEMRRQLEEVLDSLDETYARQQHRNCSPSRNRGLMSHYQWLEKNKHDARAKKALTSIVAQAGDNVGRLNSLAWDLMTDKKTTGKFDRVALALADRMESTRGRLSHQYMDTVALARFLNGQVERAVELQKKAIARGGNSDDYRRRLRTYEAAQTAVLLAKEQASKQVPGQVPAGATSVKTTGTVVATANDEDDG